MLFGSDENGISRMDRATSGKKSFPASGKGIGAQLGGAGDHWGCGGDEHPGRIDEYDSRDEIRVANRGFDRNRTTHAVANDHDIVQILVCAQHSEVVSHRAHRVVREVTDRPAVATQVNCHSEPVTGECCLQSRHVCDVAHPAVHQKNGPTGICGLTVNRSKTNEGQGQRHPWPPIRCHVQSCVRDSDVISMEVTTRETQQ